MSNVTNYRNNAGIIMQKVVHLIMTLLAGLILFIGVLFIILPGPAIIILPLGIWLFNKYQPGKIDPYARKFMKFNERMAARLDSLFKRRS